MIAIFKSALASIANALHGFAVDEVVRLGLTLLVFFMTPLILRITRGHLASRSGTMAERRERNVIWRNAIILTGFAAIVTIWGTKIAGFALSLAAVAGALLIVSKDALVNVIGFINLTVSRPFGFGDYVEIGGARGRVVDINAMSTTILETRQGHQVTGGTVLIPNAMLLTLPVRNFTVTGKYVINMLQIKLPRDSDIIAHEQALLAAAEKVCSGWEQEADAHLSRREIEHDVDLPSAKNRVILEFRDGKYVDLTLRYPCRPNERVKVEQEIVRAYIELSRDAAMGKIAGGD